MPKFDLKATERRFVLEDASGYSFEVVTQHDPELGWSAHVGFASRGMRTEDGAIDKLTTSVGQFLRMAEYADDVAAPAPSPDEGKVGG